MVSWRRAILFGFLVWLVPFVVALGLGGIRESQRILFESIMPVVVTLVVVVFAVLYLRRVNVRFVREGLFLGLLWLGMSVLIDLPLMLSAPMSMSVVEYAADVALTYLIIPIVTTGMAVAIGAVGKTA